jgi:hypothetical protein
MVKVLNSYVLVNASKHKNKFLLTLPVVVVLVVVSNIRYNTVDLRLEILTIPATAGVSATNPLIGTAFCTIKSASAVLAL